MNHLSICSNKEHEKDPLNNFCITCHIEIVLISLENIPTEFYRKESVQLILFSTNQNQEALDCLELGIQKNLSLEDTCNKIGDALRRLNKETEATNYYRKGNQIKKLNIKLLQWKSQILQKQDRFDEALICMEQLQDIDQNEYLVEKGILLHQLNKNDEALQFYDQLLEKKEKGQEVAFHNKGIILQDQKKFNEALKCFDDVLKINPLSAHSLNDRGNTLQELHKFEEAVNSYDAALEINPQQIEALIGRGNTLQELHKFQEALNCYNAALKINSQQTEALNGIGNTLSKQHKFEEALKSYDAALKINSQFAEALNGKGNTLFQINKFEEALKCYDAALKIDPQYAIALNGKGNTLQELHKFEEALNCYNAALQINPQQIEALNGKGIALSKIHQFEEALKCYNSALKINPYFTQALNGKGNTLLKLHKFEEVLKCYDAALEIDPQDQEILKKKHNLLCYMAKNKGSIKSLKQQSKINPQSIKLEEERNLYSNAINQNQLIQHLSHYEINQIQIQEQTSQDQDSLINKGKLLLQNNQFLEALNIFDEIFAENQLPEIVFYKAQTLFHLKRYEEALIYCDISESLGLYPSETAQLLEKILTELTNFQ